jgi:hypothetical protein
MAVHTFRFSSARRLRTALHPIVLAGVLGLVHLFWVRLGSFVSLALLATVALLLIRGLQWLWGGREPLRVDDQAVFRGGQRVALKGCELHLRARRAKGGPPDAYRVDEVVVFTPVDSSGGRRGVSFEVSLVDFERALTLLLDRVPDARIKVWAPGGKPLAPAPREALLAPLQSPLARALSQAGRGGLAPPAAPQPKRPAP